MLQRTQSLLPPATGIFLLSGISGFLGIISCIAGSYVFNYTRLASVYSWGVVSAGLYLIILAATAITSARQLLTPEDVNVLKGWSAEFPEVDSAFQSLRPTTKEPRFWHFWSIQRIAKRADKKREHDRVLDKLREALK